jgi:hypothetical protein
MKMTYPTLELGEAAGVCPPPAPEPARRAGETLIMQVSAAHRTELIFPSANISVHQRIPLS